MSAQTMSLSLSHSLHFTKLHASERPWRRATRVSCTSTRPRRKFAPLTTSEDSDARELARSVIKSFSDKEPLVKTLNKYVKIVRTEHCFLLFEELGRGDKWLQCLEVFRWMQKQRWYIADNGIYSKLISVMGKRGQTRMAMWLFSEMRNSGCKPDTSVYNALISAHLHSRDKSKALEKASGYFEKMKGTERCKPNVVTYNILLRAFAQARNFARVESLFEELGESGISADVYTFNGVMDAYGQLGMIREMESVLTRMKKEKVKPDVITFNLLIEAYGKKQEFEKMEQVFESLLRSKASPTLPTFNSMISSYGKARQLERAEAVFVRMTEMGFAPSLVTSESLLTMYGLCDCVSRARAVFDKLARLENGVKVSTMNAMIEAYCLNGLPGEAHKLFEGANGIGVVPNTATYKILYKAYTKAKRKELLGNLFRHIERDGIMSNKMFVLDALSSSEKAPVTSRAGKKSSRSQRERD